MENASQALLIAGGIFLVIVIITLGVYIFGSLHNFSDMQDQQTAQQQIASFNKSFEAYNRSVMYGTDLISVMNKANDHNRAHKESIEVKFKIEGTVYTIDDYENEIKNSSVLDNFKMKIFKCTYVGYSNETGRVNLMEFEEIILD